MASTIESNTWPRPGVRGLELGDEVDMRNLANRGTASERWQHEFRARTSQSPDARYFGKSCAKFEILSASMLFTLHRTHDIIAK
jgi:hypothetical protein